MSIGKIRKEEIKLYILKHIYKKDTQYIRKTEETHSISRTTVYSYLRQMEVDKIIQKNINEKDFPYSLLDNKNLFSYKTTMPLEEDMIYTNDIFPLISHLNTNVIEIWRYSFTEMMNNAIEHSEAINIKCLVIRNYLNITLVISDDGVGIFKKIKDYYLKSQQQDITLDNAVTLLFSGKFTTNERNHSGEGIFFTSRAVDEFYIYSKSKVFARSESTDKTYELKSDIMDSEKGTIVVMRQENKTHKDLCAIMNLYSDVENGFFKTNLPIAHIFPNGYPISRSEARRLGTMIQKFKEVTLDFENVKKLGQGFTHELFVVFSNNHPDITFNKINVSAEVENMINRVLNTKK